jgi:hypothetical protein
VVHAPVKAGDWLSFAVIADLGIFDRLSHASTAVIMVPGQPAVTIGINHGDPNVFWDATNRRITVNYTIPAGTPPHSIVTYQAFPDMI